MADLTPWYPPEIKPVREGWYECESCRVLHYWSGQVWASDPPGKPRVVFGRNSAAISWRGLSTPPRKRHE